MLENLEQESLAERLGAYFDHQPSPSTPSRLVPYTGIGTGSQILRDIGVGQMRLLSTPMKFPAISGFDLEVVEYVKWQEKETS